MHSTGEMNVWMSHSFYAYINHSQVNGRYKKNKTKKNLDAHTFVIIYIHVPIKTVMIFITLFK